LATSSNDFLGESVLLFLLIEDAQINTILIDGISLYITNLNKSRIVRNSCVGCILCFDSPFAYILGIIHPLFFSSHEWSWVGKGRSLLHSKTIWCNILSLKLHVRVVRNSWVCSDHLCISPVTDVLSIVNPLLLTSDERLWWWESWALAFRSSITKATLVILSIELNIIFWQLGYWFIGNSGVCCDHLSFSPITNILGAIHPLLFASDEWCWNWKGWPLAFLISVSIRSNGLNSWLVRNSCVCYDFLFISPISDILCTIHPLLLASDEWSWNW